VTRWERILWPLRSRKVQVAVATLVVGYLARRGLLLDTDTTILLVGVAVAIILGIAHEDSGAKRAK
jgi:hypothetical protein